MTSPFTILMRCGVVRHHHIIISICFAQSVLSWRASASGSRPLSQFSFVPKRQPENNTFTHLHNLIDEGRFVFSIGIMIIKPENFLSVFHGLGFRGKSLACTCSYRTHPHTHTTHTRLPVDFGRILLLLIELKSEWAIEYHRIFETNQFNFTDRFHMLLLLLRANGVAGGDGVS